jgi:hypothetical protein
MGVDRWMLMEVGCVFRIACCVVCKDGRRVKIDLVGRISGWQIL